MDESFGAYHIRNRVTIEELRAGRKKAERQDDIILKFFEAHPNQGHTPFAIWNALGQPWPITSVRRALTNLTNAGRLRKDSEHQRLEIYGVRNCVWRLDAPPEQLELSGILEYIQDKEHRTPPGDHEPTKL